MPEDKRAGLQRVRVGLTGLGAVLLIVAVSAAIFETASHRPDTANDAADNRTQQTVANMIGNEADAPADPLQEIGVTPAAPTPPAANSAGAGK
jgi:hypothetical protein